MVRSHDSFCTGARISFRCEISLQCHVNEEQPLVSVLNRPPRGLGRVALFVSPRWRRHDEGKRVNNVNTIRNQLVILVFNSPRYKFSHVNTSLL